MKPPGPGPKHRLTPLQASAAVEQVSWPIGKGPHATAGFAEHLRRSGMQQIPHLHNSMMGSAQPVCSSTWLALLGAPPPPLLLQQHLALQVWRLWQEQPPCHRVQGSGEAPLLPVQGPPAATLLLPVAASAPAPAADSCQVPFLCLNGRWSVRYKARVLPLMAGAWVPYVTGQEAATQTAYKACQTSDTEHRMGWVQSTPEQPNLGACLG